MKVEQPRSETFNNLYSIFCKKWALESKQNRRARKNFRIFILFFVESGSQIESRTAVQGQFLEFLFYLLQKVTLRVKVEQPPRDNFQNLYFIFCRRWLLERKQSSRAAKIITSCIRFFVKSAPQSQSRSDAQDKFFRIFILFFAESGSYSEGRTAVQRQFFEFLFYFLQRVAYKMKVEQPRSENFNNLYSIFCKKWALESKSNRRARKFFQNFYFIFCRRWFLE